MATKIYNPTAVLHEGKISLKYWEREEPNPSEDMFTTFNGDFKQPLYNRAHTDWLASAKIVPFRDESEVYTELYKLSPWVEGDNEFNEYLAGEIPLDSIADRLEVCQSEEVIGVKNGHPMFKDEYYAIINPVTAISPNPYQDLINLVASSYGKQMGEIIEIIKKQFKVERL